MYPAPTIWRQISDRLDEVKYFHDEAERLECENKELKLMLGTLLAVTEINEAEYAAEILYLWNKAEAAERKAFSMEAANASNLDALSSESNLEALDTERAKDSAHFHAWYVSGTSKPPKYPDPEYIWCAAMHQGRKQSAEKLAAAQARIVELDKELNYEHGRHHLTHERAEKAETRVASLTGELAACEQHVIIKQHRIDELLSREQRLVNQFSDCIDQRQKLRARVAVLEKALEGARDAFIKYEMDVEDSPPYHHRQLMERINAALAAQPSKEEAASK